MKMEQKIEHLRPLLPTISAIKNEPFMSYQRFNKGGQVAKSPFLAKSVQKS